MVNFSTKMTSAVSMVALLATTLGTSVVSAASEFLPYAEVLADNAVISTQLSEVSYRLGDTITRAELAKVTANLGGYTATECSGTVYGDVSSKLGDLCGYIEALAEAGVVSTKNANFRPTASVTRAEMTKMLLGAVGETASDVDAGYTDLTGLGDLAGYVNRANELGCASSATYFRPNATSSRGEAFKMAACAAQLDTTTTEPTVPPSDGTGSTGTTTGATIVAGALSVALDGTAVAQYVPKNASAVNVGTLKLSASTTDVSVSSITVGRSGLGANTDINKIYASIDGVVNNNNSYNSSSQEGTIFFSPALVVKAGTSTKVQVLVSLIDKAQSNSQHQFTVKSVSSNASASTGTPVTLGLINTTSATVASVTVTNAGSTSTYRVGDKNVEIGQFKVANDADEDKDVIFSAITLRNNGTGDMGKNLSNVALYVNGTKVSSGVTVNSKNLTITLSDKILYGRTNTYSLRGDINGVDNTSGDTYEFSVRNTTDVSASEVTTGFGVNVSGTPTLAEYKVSGGDVILTRDASVGSTATVAQGSNDVVLLAGTIAVAGPINLESYTATFTNTSGAVVPSNTFSSLKLVIDGVTVATATPGSEMTVSFDGKYSVSKTSTIRVVGNVRSTATAGVTWKVGDLDESDFAVKEYVSNGNVIDTNSFIGSVAGINTTIGNASITFSRNDGIAAQNIVAGSTNLVLARYSVTATDTSDVKVTQVKFTNSGVLSSNTNLTAVKLYVAGNLVSTKTFSAGNADFNDVNITVPKNGSVQLEVRGDFTTAVTTGNTFALALANSNVTAQDTNSTNLLTTNILAPANGPIYSFVAAGSIELTKNSGSPSAAIIRAGMTDVEVARVGFSATDDDLILRELYLTNTGSASGSNLADVVSSARLVDEAGLLLANGVVVGKSIRFSVSDSGFSVPKNTSSRYAKVLLSISADSITSSGASNKIVSLATGTGSDFTPVTGTVKGVRFVSKSTGNDVTTVNSPIGTVLSNTHLVTRSSIVVAAPTTGTFSRQSFTVEAGTSNKVQLAGFTFDTNVASLSGNIYKDSVNAGNKLGTITTINGSNTVTFSSPIEISAGTKMTFYVDYTNVTSSSNGTAIRTFKVTDASFIDMMNTGGDITISSVSPYNNAGVPSDEQKSTY